MVKNGGVLTCIDKLTGEILYRQRLNTPGPQVSFPIVFNDSIITASSDGFANVFRVGEKFERVSFTNMGEQIMATPAVADGVLYIRTASAMYAFRKS